jgi:hypothetical protein
MCGRSERLPKRGRPVPPLPGRCLVTRLGPLDAAAALILLAPVFGDLNYRLLGKPQTTGLTIMGPFEGALAIGREAVTTFAQLED